MAIFLTDPLIDSLRPKPPEEPDVPDYGGQDYPSFPQAQVQQAPQLGTYAPQPAPSTYSYAQPNSYDIPSLGPQASMQDRLARLAQSSPGPTAEASRAFDPRLFTGIPLSPQDEPINDSSMSSVPKNLAGLTFSPYTEALGLKKFSDEKLRPLPFVGNTLANTLDLSLTPATYLPGLGFGKGALKFVGRGLAGSAGLESLGQLSGASPETKNLLSAVGGVVGPFAGSAVNVVDKGLGGLLGVKQAALRNADPVLAASEAAFQRAQIAAGKIAPTYENMFTPIERLINEIKSSPAPTNFVDFTKKPLTENVFPLEVGTTVRLTGAQAEKYGVGLKSDGAGFFAVKEDGLLARFAEAPKTADANFLRRDPANIARGREELTSRFDMEVRLGRIPEQTAAWGRAFIEALPESYIYNLSSSFVRNLGELPGGAAGEVLAGQYDPVRLIVKISKDVLKNNSDPSRTIIHEIAHHLEQFVSPVDAKQLSIQYARELAGKGKRAIAEYSTAQSALAELQQNARLGAAGIEGRIAEIIANVKDAPAFQVVNALQQETVNAFRNAPGYEGQLSAAVRRVSQAQKSQYRYTGFPEWFAENITDHFQSEVLYKPAVGIWAKMVDHVKAFGEAVIEATRRVTGREDVMGRVYNDIMDARYNPVERRDLFSGAAAENRAVGLSGAARAANAVASQGAAGAGGALGNIGAAVARAPEVQKAIDDAAEAVRQDRPGMLGRLLAEFPILTRKSGSSKLGDDVLIADVSRNMVRSYLEQLLGFGKGRLKNGAEFTLHDMPETRLISGIDDAFGAGASRGAKVDAPFIGTRAESHALVAGEGEVEYSALNTFKDIAERPQLYNLTPEQKAIIAAGEARNEASRVFVNTKYAKPGEELITQFPVAPGGMHLPTIDKSEAQQAIDLYAKGSNSTQQAVKSAAEKQREFATGWDRFVSEAGQTNLPITDPLYLNPKNYAIPETNIQQLVRGMDNAKIGAASAQTFREALGGKSNIFTGTPAEQARQVRTLRGNGYELVEHGVDLWFPREKAAQIENILKIFDDTGRFNQFAGTIKAINSQVLSGDLSPIIGVQGQLSMILSPIDTAKAIFQAAIKAGKAGDLFNAFRSETMAELAVKNPRYADYAGALGVSFRSEVPDELVGYTRFLNKFKIGDKYRQINEGLYNFVIKSQFELMDDLVTSSLKRGVPYREALAAAADTATSVYPTGTRALTGLSQEQTFLNSLPFTSLNFIKKPFALTVKGVSGIAKTVTSPATGIKASERERNAAKTLVKMWGTVLTTSAISQMLDAYLRGDDIDQAALDAVNPFSTNFARMKLIGTQYSIPLGGPLRAIVVLASGVISPRQNDSYLSSPTRYLTGRISPTIKTGKELVLNSDFYGNPIWRAADSAEVAVAKGLFHVGMGVFPLAVSQPYQSYRQKKGVAETAVDLVSAVGGVSVSEMSNTAKLNELSRKMGKGNDFYALERYEQDEVKGSPEGKLIAEDQREANLRGSETRAQRQKLTDAANEEMQKGVEIYRKAPAGTVGQIDAMRNLRALLSKVQAESAAQRDVMLSDFKPAPNPITDSYYAALKAGNVLGVAKIDRTPVDNWLATQGKNPVEGGKPGDTWADYVDRNTGLSFNNIPEIKELHEAQKAIAKSGWWDLSDKAAVSFAPYLFSGSTLSEIKTQNDLVRALTTQAAETYKDDLLYQKVYVDKLLGKFDDLLSRDRSLFLQEPDNEKIKTLLRDYGYSSSRSVFN